MIYFRLKGEREFPNKVGSVRHSCVKEGVLRNPRIPENIRVYTALAKHFITVNLVLTGCV